MSVQLTEGMKVDVWLGNGALPPLPGTVTKVVPEKEFPYKVVFDDPLVYGGAGAGWFNETQVALPGFIPRQAS